MERSAARERMNELGSKGIPFIFVIDFEMEKPRVFTVDEAINGQIYFQINGLRNLPPTIEPGFKMEWEVEPIPFFLYKKGFDHVLQNILHGNSYLLNLTYPTKVLTNLSLESLFSISQAKYKLCFPGDFLVFSPETFVRIENDRIYTYPMKGTIDASEEGNAGLLMNDPKELSEHFTIVDLMRNDLSMIALEVEVTKFRYLEKIPASGGGLYQTSSEITGKLPDGWHGRIGDTLFELLPAGSVSGAPKKKTLEIISCAETGPRGYYTGVFGYFDGRSLDSAVMIRYIEKDGENYFFRSGGGLTFQSDARKEFQELINKVYVPVY